MFISVNKHIIQYLYCEVLFYMRTLVFMQHKYIPKKHKYML